MLLSYRLPAGAIALALAVVLSHGSPAKAGPIIDPTGDFLPTFKGAQNGAFDVVLADGTFDGATFHLTATLAGPVSGAPAGSVPLYVWGINTGTGTGNFANIGNPDVRFNNVFTLNAAGITNNPNVTGSISGNNISLSIPLSVLPSTGFAATDYRWNLWPRDTSAPVAAPPIGNATAIADFAPDNATARFDLIGLAAPEPASLVVFGMMGAAGLIARRASRKPRVAKV